MVKEKTKVVFIVIVVVVPVVVVAAVAVVIVVVVGGKSRIRRWGRTMASTELEPVTWCWGWSPSRVQGRAPTGGQRAKSFQKLKAFRPFSYKSGTKR